MKARVAALVEFRTTILLAAIMMSVRCRVVASLVVVLLVAVVLEVVVEVAAALVLRTRRLAVAVVGNFAPIVELMVFGEAGTHLLEVDVLLVATATSVHALVLVMRSCTEAALDPLRHVTLFGSEVIIAAHARAIRAFRARY